MKRVILVFVALLMVSGGLFAQHRYDRGPRDVNRTRVHGYYSHTPRVHGGIYIGNGYDYGYDYTFANELYAMYGSEYRRWERLPVQKQVLDALKKQAKTTL